MMSRGILLLFLGAVLAGCGGSGETKTVTVDGAAAATGPPTTTGPTTGTPGPGSEKGASSTGPALAERTGKIDDTPVRLEIAELKRTSGTTALVLRLTTTAEDSVAQFGTTFVGRTFDDGVEQKSTAPDADSLIGGSTLDGVYLIDGTNRKKYLVGRDAQNLCTCDSELGSARVGAEPLTLSATFGAPPPDVRSIDVFVPRFGTFKDVPLG